MGEAIPIRLSFSSSDPTRYNIDLATYDRSGRMDLDEFQLSPKNGWSDPLDFYYRSGLFSFMGGGLRSVPQLEAEEQNIDLDLTDWVRFDQPGHYRLSVTSSRVIKDRAKRNFGTSIQVTSNEVELEVVAADEAWLRQQVLRASTDLKASDREVSFRGAHALRILNTEDAAAAMVDQFGRFSDGQDGNLEFGLLGSTHRRFIVGHMEEELDQPDHPITTSFVHLLAALAFQIDHPEPLPDLPSRFAPVPDEIREQIEHQTKDRQAEFHPYVTRYLARLSKSLPQRHGESYAQALTTILVEAAEAGSLDTPRFAGFLDQLRTNLPSVFLNLPAGAQDSLLNFWWADIRSKKMLPVLLQKFNGAPRGPFGERYLALIADLDPELARKLVREDMASPEPTLLYDQVHLFGEEPLPDMEQILVKNLQRAAKANSPSLRTFSLLVERHATENVLPKVKTVYAKLTKSHDSTIDAFLLAYLFRTDFNYASQALANHDRKCLEPSSRCALLEPSVLALALKHGPSKQIEELAVSRVQSGDPFVARDGAEALKAAGTAEAESVLWNRLNIWHEKWNGKVEELEHQDNQEEAALGTTLTEAIAQGNGWITDLEKLKKLETLSVLEGQRKRVVDFEDRWKQGPELEIILFSFNEYWPHVAQYEYQGIDEIWPKLAEFPPGTVLSFHPEHQPEARGQVGALIERVQEFAKQHQLTLKLRHDE